MSSSSESMKKSSDTAISNNNQSESQRPIDVHEKNRLNKISGESQSTCYWYVIKFRHYFLNQTGQLFF